MHEGGIEVKLRSLVTLELDRQTDGRVTLRERTAVPVEEEAGRASEPVGTFRKCGKSLAAIRVWNCGYFSL
jgi:hypothetical protein